MGPSRNQQSIQTEGKGACAFAARNGPRLERRSWNAKGTMPQTSKVRLRAIARGPNGNPLHLTRTCSAKCLWRLSDGAQVTRKKCGDLEKRESKESCNVAHQTRGGRWKRHFPYSAGTLIKQGGNLGPAMKKSWADDGCAKSRRSER